MKYVEAIKVEDTIKIEKAIENKRVKCDCGHTINFANARNGRVLCNWCRQYVYASKEIEFKYKMKEAMNKK